MKEKILTSPQERLRHAPPLRIASPISYQKQEVPTRVWLPVPEWVAKMAGRTVAVVLRAQEGGDGSVVVGTAGVAGKLMLVPKIRLT